MLKFKLRGKSTGSTAVAATVSVPGTGSVSPPMHCVGTRGGILSFIVEETLGVLGGEVIVDDAAF